MSFSYLLSEVRELIEAIVELDADHVLEEWNDVMLCALIWLSRFLPLGWVPLRSGMGRSSVIKFEARIAVWLEIYAHHGRTFRKEYMSGGSNYRKRHKVQTALRRAGQTDVDWQWVEARVGGFEAC
jgi:hypothetical protein